MSREILVVTPENIEIEYELGGIGSRFLAHLVDVLLQCALFIGGAVALLLIGFVLNLIGTPLAKAVTDFFSGILEALAFIGGFLLMWGYFIYFETRWNGQTPGKRQLGLRVIRDGGFPINIYAAIVRNLLRVVDGMPVITFGLIVAG
ncbi:MAG: RDD family protein, partial [Armatimonadetes bacterium]|nr:RDD family protein [Armatimonadota bacterium]